MATTITVKDFAFRRSSEPGYLPDSLNRGEPFFQFADRFWIIGDGESAPDTLPRIPLFSEEDFLRPDSPITTALALQAAGAVNRFLATLIPIRNVPRLISDALNAAAYTTAQMVGDGDANIETATAYLGVQTLTASLTLTLPSAADYPRGQPLYVADESGACSDTRLITVAAKGSDRIAGSPSVQLAAPYQKLTLHSNGSNLWTYA